MRVFARASVVLVVQIHAIILHPPLVHHHW